MQAPFITRRRLVYESRNRFPSPSAGSLAQTASRTSSNMWSGTAPARNGVSILRTAARFCARKPSYSFLMEEERRLADRLRHEPPLGDLRYLLYRAVYYWTVTGALTIAGFALTLLAFDPFRLGWKAWVYCLGIAIVTPFLVEKVLEHWNAERLIKAMAALGCAAAMASLMILAVIRGNLLATEGTSNEPAVTHGRCNPCSAAATPE